MRKVNLIPMAGLGQRFIDEGYTIPKPLIEINGLPMCVKAARCLPNADQWIFICKKEHIELMRIDEVLRNFFPGATIIPIDYTTNGQASTCLIARELLNKDDILTIGACDNGMSYSHSVFKNKIKNNDAIIWTFRNNKSVLKNPSMYGWADVHDDGHATRISCKKPISNSPMKDHALVGTFTFKRAEHFLKYTERMIKKNLRINNEFYLDIVLSECINDNLKVIPLEVETYNCWGTPSDLLKYLGQEVYKK